MTGWLAAFGHGYANAVATVDRFCATPLGHVVTWIVGIVAFALFIRGGYRQNGVPQATFRATGMGGGLLLLLLLRPYLVAHYRWPEWLAIGAMYAVYIVLLYVLGAILTSGLVTRMCGGGGGNGP